MTTIGLYSDSAVIGGAEISTLNLAAAHDDPEISLVVCSTNAELLSRAARIPGVRTHLVELRRAGISSVLDHRRTFTSLGLDLLQVTLAGPFAARPALLGGFLAGVPVVAVEHLVFPSRRRRGAVVKRLFAAAQAKTIAVGRATAADLTAFFHIPASRIAVVHNGVRDIAPATRSPHSSPVVGCVARLEDQKGVDLLLEAISAIPGVDLVIIGDGSRRAELEQQAERLHIADRVRFTGWIDDAASRIAGFDVFALASRNEAFPLTIVEAMLAGTAVVATDVGSVAEVVLHERTGLLVPAGDVPALTDAIRQLVQDPALRDRLAGVARAHALEHLTDTAMAAGYRRVWRHVLDARSDSWIRRRTLLARRTGARSATG